MHRLVIRCSEFCKVTNLVASKVGNHGKASQSDNAAIVSSDHHGG